MNLTLLLLENKIMTNMPQFIKNFTFGNLSLIKLSMILLCILLLSSITSMAQSITWQRILDSTHYGGVSKILQTSDGEYAAVGNVRINNLYKINLTKIDIHGNILWVKIYGTGYAVARWAEETTDKGLIICGYSDSASGNSKVYLLKTDSTGNILWQRYYTYSSLDQGNCVKQTSDGGFILACRNTLMSYDDGLIIKTDNAGIRQWQKVITYNTAISLKELEIVPNGYLFAGWINSQPSNALLIKTNLVGDTIWTKTYGGSGSDAAYSLELLGNHGYLIAGSTGSFSVSNTESYLIKTDTSGSMIWQKSYSGSYSEVCNAVKYKPGTGYVMAGYMDTTEISHSRALIKMVDTNGILLRQQTFFPSNRGGDFNDIELANDGGFICGGGANNNSAFSMYVAKTDSLFQALPIGITQISGIVPNESILYQNFPNPFNPNTKIVFQLTNSSRARISLYDVSGRFVYNIIDKWLLHGSYEISLDLGSQNISSGVYFYSLFINKSKYPIQSKKMIYLK